MRDETWHDDGFSVVKGTCWRGRSWKSGLEKWQGGPAALPWKKMGHSGASSGRPTLRACPRLACVASPPSSCPSQLGRLCSSPRLEFSPEYMLCASMVHLSPLPCALLSASTPGSAGLWELRHPSLGDRTFLMGSSLPELPPFSSL